jgi:phytoene dehydrogenase-like protein
VIEGRDTIGGGTRTEEVTEPGVFSDVCSAVHPLGIGSPYLGSLPLADHGLHWVHPPIPFAHVLPDGESVLVHGSLEETAAGLGEDGPVWESIFGPFARDWEQTARLATAHPMRAVRSPFAGLRLARYGLRSGRYLANRFSTERGRAVIAGMAAHAVAPLDTAAAGGVALVLGAAAHAVGWPFALGGSAAITTALASYLDSLGGEIETGHWVARMSDLPDARVVLFDTSAQAAQSIAGERIKGRTRRRYRNRPVGSGSFKVDIALNGPIPWADPRLVGAGTVHIGGDYDEIALSEARTAGGEHAEHPFVLLAQPLAADPTRAPEGISAVWAYCHVPTGSTLDMTDRITGQIERFAPGFRSRIRTISSMGPSAIEAKNPNYIGGDITGGPVSLMGVMRRPTLFHPYRAGKGLYLCSAVTPPGAGVHGMCGYHAARAALREM